MAFADFLLGICQITECGTNPCWAFVDFLLGLTKVLKMAWNRDGYLSTSYKTFAKVPNKTWSRAVLIDFSFWPVAAIAVRVNCPATI